MLNDKKSQELVQKIKKNDFCSFLSALIDGNIVLKKTEEGNGVDLQLLNDLITPENKQPNKDNVKVNAINNLNKKASLDKESYLSKQASLTGAFFKSLKIAAKKTKLFFGFLARKLTISPIFKSTTEKTDTS